MNSFQEKVLATLFFSPISGFEPLSPGQRILGRWVVDHGVLDPAVGNLQARNKFIEVLRGCRLDASREDRDRIGRPEFGTTPSMSLLEAAGNALGVFRHEWSPTSHEVEMKVTVTVDRGGFTQAELNLIADSVEKAIGVGRNLTPPSWQGLATYTKAVKVTDPKARVNGP